MFRYLLLILVLSLIPFSMSFAQDDSYELDESLCLGGPGMEFDEDCHRIRPSPYVQQKEGTTPENIRCNHDLYRSYKTSDGTAFCVSGYSLKELIHRGYAQTFDSINSATIGMSGSIVKEYCPASQELLQWGWYGYVRNPEIINTNIDLVYDSEEDSHGVEFAFESKTDGKSMIWVFVECRENSELDTLEDLKNHPLVDEFYAKYPDAHEEVRTDHVSYFIGSDDGFKVRMNLYFDENNKLDYVNLRCYLDRELQTDVPGSFISKYLKDFTCDEYGSQRNEN